MVESGVFYANQNLGGDWMAGGMVDDGTRNAEALEKFMIFIQETQERNTFIYREQLQKNAREGKYFLKISMQLLLNFDENLAQRLRMEPEAMIPVLEDAIGKVYHNNYHAAISGDDLAPVPKFQAQIFTDEKFRTLRDLQSNLVGRLICVPGIITSASRSAIKATSITYRCCNCGHEFTRKINFGFGGAAAPRQCAQALNPGMDKQMCPLDPYRVIPEKCDFIDQQTLKLQDAPELIPTGEMPRTLILTVDRELTDKVTPGNRVKIIGILSIQSMSQGGVGASGQANKGVNKSYIRVCGIQSETNQSGMPSTAGFALPTITQEDEEKIVKLSRDPEVYEKISRSIASAIYGHPDIKRAVACLLFGGSPKKLKDGMKLRGDINVLLLGDPSVAKSQFLKFVERVAPIAVYTSGKGTSAAGLTAAVMKDAATGEFQLEGGAMVLADGGVVCIDEFDKMRPQDRVAIHEAMEQQTISIAKAGITTILNSRTSVLAAANPLAGRYDDLKHASEQIDFQASILSRFDAIFIVRDQREESIDKAIAHHVVNLHMNRINQQAANSADVSVEDLKKYLTYAKMKISPRLGEEAGHILQDLYVSDRMKSKQQCTSSKTTGIPITVRQLEAIIRMSESIAKMHLQNVVTPEHVREAHRLFRISTLNAAASGLSASQKETPEELRDMVQRIEEAIKRRVAIGSKIAYPVLQRELQNRFDNERAIGFAIMAMIKRDEFKHQEARKILERKK